MGILKDASLTAGRARYAATQGVRAAWYAAQMGVARRRASGFNRPGEPAFKPSRGSPDMAVLRKAYLSLFVQDRLNVEAGLYPAPKDTQIKDLPRALQSAAAFQRDVDEVDRRRVARNGTEVQDMLDPNSNRYPEYYRQNFHYQSDGWFSDESERLYDTQVEALFTGTAAAMRRAALAEIAREMKGRDQRGVTLLDMACGNGRFLVDVMRVFPRLQAGGLDLSPNYAEAARRNVSGWPQVGIVEEAAEAMPFADASQDIVVSIFLFHELPPEVRPRVLAEVSRVLKPGGLFVLNDSVQFGDYPEMDGLLEYFPHGFHEPYYDGYLSWDLAGDAAGAGLTLEREQLAFLSKVTCWRKLGEGI
jgi:ubiquinone/menaquinone biosynthesis C-methylase UbiE